MSTQPVREVRVNLTENSIEPSTIQIPADFPIRFVIHNAGDHVREFTIKGIPGAQVENILPGQTTVVTLTFTKIGTFETASISGSEQVVSPTGQIVIETFY